MNALIPWSQWIDLIKPYYYNKKRGRRPIDIEIMLRMYLMQNWFNLSDEGMEEAIYDSYAMRKEIENRKSSVRCKVEHPFLIVKRQFGYAKVVYRGIYKNMNRFHILFASANLVKCFRAGRTEEFCMA